MSVTSRVAWVLGQQKKPFTDGGVYYDYYPPTFICIHSITTKLCTFVKEKALSAALSLSDLHFEMRHKNELRVYSTVDTKT